MRTKLKEKSGISLWLLTFLISSFYANVSFGEKLSVAGRASLETLVSSLNRQPFYLWSNMLGQISVWDQYQTIANFSGGAFYCLENENHLFFTGIDTNLKQGSDINYNLVELYGGFQSKYFRITGGLFADSVRMAGLSPTNGNFLITRNASPHPRVRLSSNGFIQIARKELFIAVLYEDGILNDSRFVKKAKLHHKNFYIRIGNPINLQITAGVDHFVLWGGHTSEEKYDEKLRDYFNAVWGGSYYDENIEMRNTIGNQLGQYLFSLQKSFGNIKSTFQVSHIFEDRSGVNFMNYPDNIYTLLLEWRHANLLKKVLLEYTFTKHQSGPLIDPVTGEYRASSRDNYFSHSQYRSGFTYDGFIMGNPLFGPLKFDEEGMVNGPENNRFFSCHLGFSGELYRDLNYILMLTYSENYGRLAFPYEKVRNQFFSLVSFTYTFSRSKNLYVKTNIAFDSGSLWTGEQSSETGVAINFGIKF